MSEFFIAGIAMTGLGKFVDRSVKSLTAEAVFLALSDAGAQISDIEAAWFSNTRQGLLEGQNAIRGQCALRPLGVEKIPIVNVENACASGSTAMLQGLAHLQADFCDIALVVGAEKMFFPEQRQAMFQAFKGGTDIHRLEEFQHKVTRQCSDLIPKQLRAVDSGQRSFFMDSYAAQARLHMQTFGTTQRQFACVAAKNHWHSTMNPAAQYQQDMTVDQVLQGRLISWPHTLPMCAPISDGAAAAVICSIKGLKKLGISSTHKRLVRIRGISLASGSSRADDDFNNHVGAIAARDAYHKASLNPKDIDVAEVHDACAYAEIQQIENLGLCAPGEGGIFSEQGHSKLGGKLPVNPSGGLVSKGHPVGATGIMQLCELSTQLRGEAGQRQVAGARIAVAENGGGFYENEEAVTAVTILEKN